MAAREDNILCVSGLPPSLCRRAAVAWTPTVVPLKKDHTLYLILLSDLSSPTIVVIIKYDDEVELSLV